MLKRVYVWEFPVRLTHWINVMCIISLSITGYYIGNPFIHAISADQYIMGWMRFIHFVTAYLFVASFIVRIYWMFAGNKYANWKEFCYFNSQKFGELIDDIKFYTFLKKEQRHIRGHTALASTIYLGLWILFTIEILTGFALYSQSHYGTFWKFAGGWLFSIISAPTVRLYHHLIMWIIIFFAIEHIYLAWFNDREQKGGFISSIFSGYKTVNEE